MTKEEARKRAEVLNIDHFEGDYAESDSVFVVYLDNGKKIQFTGSAEFSKFVTHIYMQCWNDMTSGKPDGWCAWHPTESFFPATDEGGVFVAKEPEHITLSNNSPHSKRMQSNGWRINPVKLLVMEEENQEK